MSYKDQLIMELDSAADPLIAEVLDFLLYLKAKQAEDDEDLADARQILATVGIEGTIAWDTLKAETGL
jgi:hypothetical protein